MGMVHSCCELILELREETAVLLELMGLDAWRDLAIQ